MSDPSQMTPAAVLMRTVRGARACNEPVLPLYLALGAGARVLPAIIEANFTRGLAAVLKLTAEVMGKLQQDELKEQGNKPDALSVVDGLGFGGGYDLGRRRGKIDEAELAAAVDADLQTELAAAVNLAWLRASTVWWRATDTAAVEALADILRFAIGLDPRFRTTLLKVVGGQRALFLAIVGEGHTPTIEKLADAWVATTDETRDDAFFRLVPLEVVVRVSDREALWMACGSALDMLEQALGREGNGAQARAAATPPAPPQPCPLGCGATNPAAATQCSGCNQPLASAPAEAAPPPA